MIDVNVSISRWPFRRLPDDETPRLVARLCRHGVTRAWAGSFDALLHRDIAAVNERLAEECRKHGGGLLVPFGAVNPALPDWEEDLRRCREVHRMPGIRLHPNYHGYTLDDPAFRKLLDAAARAGLIVQLAVTMEDERTQHPLVRVPPVDVAPLAGILKDLPGLRLVILNGLRTMKEEVVETLAAAGVAGFDLAMLEGIDGLGRMIRRIDPGKILFGLNAPLFTFESAPLKLTEAALDPAAERAVCEGNALRLLDRH